MPAAFLEYIRSKGSRSPWARTDTVRIGGATVPRFFDEFWTARQRQASSLHEISYRACFKPQLPRFFIQALTRPGDVVYDPFSGRGTTVIEAGLLGRNVAANDINPLSRLLTAPRFWVPSLEEVAARLDALDLTREARADMDLSMFYHPRTEAEIVNLRAYLLEREARGQADHVDNWIRMVATNRLTGHSSGFFSVYTLPPNQAVSPERQMLINVSRRQKPEYRDIRSRILRKSRSLMRSLSKNDIVALRQAGQRAVFLSKDARCTRELPADYVHLTVTSPPFLNVVQYARDNWLRCWFNGIDAGKVEREITASNSLAAWSQVMEAVFAELYRITAPGGWVAFEVGEVRRGTVNLDEHAAPLGMKAGFRCVAILINCQQFTKTANIWGVRNNDVGTNTNRIVVFHKE